MIRLIDRAATARWIAVEVARKSSPIVRGGARRVIADRTWRSLRTWQEQMTIAMASRPRSHAAAGLITAGRPAG